VPLAAITDELVAALEPLRFGAPVTHVYNPLVHGRRAWDRYCALYGGGAKQVVLVGMNPGPWGMVQTGVPFGEVGMVRDWLGIDEPVDAPAEQHPKRPVLGFACTRREVSGSRLWGWARARCSEPRRFFARYFVLNYCPLAFLEAGGKNRTPDKLLAAERAGLVGACDHALRRSIEALGPQHVVGVGAYAFGVARRALSGLDVQLSRVLHPSPASPLANRGWAEQAERQLVEAGVPLP